MERKYTKTKKLLIDQIIQKDVSICTYVDNKELFDKCGCAGFLDNVFEFGWITGDMLDVKLSDLVKLYEIVC
jgi:hypothetical protein